MDIYNNNNAEISQCVHIAGNMCQVREVLFFIITTLIYMYCIWWLFRWVVFGSVMYLREDMAGSTQASVVSAECVCEPHAYENIMVSMACA